MKIFIKVILLFHTFSNIESKCEVHLYSKAIQSIVGEYQKNNMKFDVLIVERGRNQLEFASMILSNILKTTNKNYTSIKLFREKQDGPYIRLDRSTIIIVEDYRTVSLLNRKIKMTNEDYLKFQHLIVVRKPTQLNKLSYIIVNDPPPMLSSIVMYETLLICENDSLVLAKDDVFQRKNATHCEDNFIEINKFNKSFNIFNTKNFGLEDLSDLNGCKIVIHQSQGEKIDHQRQIIISLLKSFQKELNFTLELLDNNGNLDDYHFTFHTYAAEHPFIKIPVSSFKYKLYEIESALIVSIGEAYTSYEKFILPLDVGTWICCGVFFGGAFIIIFIISRLNNRMVRDFVFGRRVTSPAFNVLIAFFGQSQNILPRRNFARYLLILFIMFCLIIRTGYQGVQFELIFKVREKLKI
jgi:hypothetical protein